MYSLTSTLLVLLLVTLINGHPSNVDNGNSKENEILTRDLLGCRSWYRGEGDPSILLAQTLNPPCSIPPTFPETLLDGWVVDPGCDAAQQPNTCGLHKGAHGCYRHAFASTGPGAQACYDQNGQWISDPWKGAGTLDAETPLGDLAQQARHGIVDVATYYSCCTTWLAKQPETCNLYYEKRPPGQCEDKPAI